jgi:hypothetical protein
LTSFTEFYDIIAANFSNAPFVSGGIVAVYVTGPSSIQESAAQIAAAEAAGMTVLTIDQQPGLATFAAGNAEIADVEAGAGSNSDAANAVLARQALGLISTIYISYSNLSALESALQSAGCNMADVYFGVADYDWSLEEAESLLASNPQWGYCQYGDPASNPSTLIPGTNVTLQQAQADIDVADDTWLGLVTQPAPSPAPPPNMEDEYQMDLQTGTGTFDVLRFPSFPVVLCFGTDIGYTGGNPTSIRVALHNGTNNTWAVQTVTLTEAAPSPFINLPANLIDLVSFVRQDDGPVVSVSWR